MSRSDVSAGMAADLSGPAFICSPIVELDFAGDPVYAWGGSVPLSWQGRTWLPVGDLGSISPMNSSADGRIENLTLTLRGFEAAFLSEATTTNYKGRTGRVWFALINDDQTLRQEPALFFAGSISQMTLAESRGSAEISIIIESRDVLLRNVVASLRTDSDHQSREPGDTFFRSVPDVLSKPIYWGLRADSASPRGSGGVAAFTNDGGFGLPNAQLASL